MMKSDDHHEMMMWHRQGADTLRDQYIKDKSEADKLHHLWHWMAGGLKYRLHDLAAGLHRLAADLHRNGKPKDGAEWGRIAEKLSRKLEENDWQ